MAPEIVLWLAVNVLGALFSLFNWLDALTDRELAGRDDVREDWYAWHAIRREFLRLVTLVLFTLAALASVAALPRGAVLTLLILGAALVAINSAADRYERLRARDGDWPTPGNGLGQSGEPGID